MLQFYPSDAISQTCITSAKTTTCTLDTGSFCSNSDYLITKTPADDAAISDKIYSIPSRVKQSNFTNFYAPIHKFPIICPTLQSDPAAQDPEPEDPAPVEPTPVDPEPEPVDPKNPAPEDPEPEPAPEDPEPEPAPVDPKNPKNFRLLS